MRILLLFHHSWTWCKHSQPVRKFDLIETLASRERVFSLRNLSCTGLNPCCRRKRTHSDIKKSAISSAARGRLNLLMFPAHSHHCVALLSNARCTCSAISREECAMTPELVSTINCALPSS